ncbi:MAG: fluoride efflux transporter CrcB [Pseudomonadota bacterium]
MVNTLLLVALGGALGASLRYLWGVGLFRMIGGPLDFPVAIMTANILGSFLMGAFVVFAAQRGATHLSPFVMTGLLGGFTTFSAFSLEAVTLIERGALGQAGVYVALSVGLSILGLIAGLWLMRTVLL